MVPEACRFRATPMDVAEWLRGLGLEQYAPAFRDNDIDGEVLRRLTGEDLRELGVASVGHRRRLLDAVAALGNAQPAPTASPTVPTGVGAAAEAERRQLTVMLCLAKSSCLQAVVAPLALQSPQAVRQVKALTRNGSDPLNAPHPGRTGDKSNLKRQGHGILIDKVY